MANAKIISYIDAVTNAAVADIRNVTEADLQLAIDLIDDELIELRARLAKLEQGGGPTHRLSDETQTDN